MDNACTPDMAEGLNTYAYNVCYKTLSVRYRGIALVPSRVAMRELLEEGKTLYDVAHILQHGKDAPRRRKRGTIERWLYQGAKTYNVVIAKDYHEIMKEEVWVIVHFGKFTRRKIP